MNPERTYSVIKLVCLKINYYHNYSTHYTAKSMTLWGLIKGGSGAGFLKNNTFEIKDLKIWGGGERNRPELLLQNRLHENRAYFWILGFCCVSCTISNYTRDMSKLCYWVTGQDSGRGKQLNLLRYRVGPPAISGYFAPPYTFCALGWICAQNPAPTLRLM